MEPVSFSRRTLLNGVNKLYLEHTQHKIYSVRNVDFSVLQDMIQYMPVVKVKQSI